MSKNPPVNYQKMFYVSVFIGIILLVIFGVITFLYNPQNQKTPSDNKTLTKTKEHLYNTTKFCGYSTNAYCKDDSDCIITGCSNQVCGSRADKGMITTCEYKECYNYRKYNVSCKCVNHHCRWA